MKKILALNGSPHEYGSTAALINEVTKSSAEQGAIIKTYYLNGMNIKGCQACKDCRTRNKCRVQDGMQILYNEIQEADGIIFGTPVYMWQMSAQLKTVIDRMQAFLTPDHKNTLKSGKKALIAAAQGQNDAAMFRHYFEHFGNSLVSIFHFAEYKLLIAGGTHEVEDVLKQTELLKDAAEMGVWLTE